MTTRNQHRLRVLAIAMLLAFGGAILGVLLTIAFPTFGIPQSFSGFLYIPPQAFLVALLAPTTLVLAFATGISGLSQSLRARQPGWAGAFTVILLLLTTGPAYLLCSFGVGWSLFPHPPAIPTLQDLGWQADAWWVLTASSAALLALTAICAFIYASRDIPPGEPSQERG